LPSGNAQFSTPLAAPVVVEQENVIRLQGYPKIADPFAAAISHCVLENN
jgi:hypothetical protein